MITGYMESTLSQSEVFTGLNDELHIKDKATTLIKNSRHLTPEDIEAAYIQVKQITDTLTSKAVRAFENEETVLVYNTAKKLSMSQGVPFITLKTGSGRKTYVFMDNYVKMPNPGQMKVDPTILRDLLIGGYLSTAIRNNYNNLASNQFLAKISMQMYEKFFTRVLNRLYSIASDKVMFESIRFYINRFFLERIFGATETTENMNKLARDHIKVMDEIGIDQIQKNYASKDPSHISDLLDILKELSPRLKSLTLGKYLNEWINYYHEPFTLAIDNIEFFLWGVIVLLHGSPLINGHAADIVTEQKGIKNIAAELIKI